MPPFKVGSEIIITPEAKAEALADQFALNHENPLAGNNISFTRYVTTTVKRFCQNVTPQSISPKFASAEEVKQNAARLKNSKAPGQDRVHNRLIKKIPPEGFLFLTFIINCCLRLSYFPDRWKTAKVIGIKKPNKPPNNPNSYRPISLVSSLSKLLERILLTRINWHLEDHEIIPDQQHGFRTQKSTVTQLRRLKEKVKEGLK